MIELSLTEAEMFGVGSSYVKLIVAVLRRIDPTASWAFSSRYEDAGTVKVPLAFKNSVEPPPDAGTSPFRAEVKVAKMLVAWAELRSAGTPPATLPLRVAAPMLANFAFVTAPGSIVQALPAPVTVRSPLSPSGTSTLTMLPDVRMKSQEVWPETKIATCNGFRVTSSTPASVRIANVPAAPLLPMWYFRPPPAGIGGRNTVRAPPRGSKRRNPGPLALIL